MKNKNKFIDDSLRYYSQFYVVDISEQFHRKSEDCGLNFIDYAYKFLKIQELEEMYKIGLEDYCIDFCFHTYIKYLCTPEESLRHRYFYSYRHRNPMLFNKNNFRKRQSFRQPKFGKFTKKVKLKNNGLKYNKSPKSYKKKWKNCVRKTGQKSLRRWYKNEIKKILDIKDYSEGFSTNNSKEVKYFINKWDW